MANIYKVSGAEIYNHISKVSGVSKPDIYKVSGFIAVDKRALNQTIIDATAAFITPTNWNANGRYTAGTWNTFRASYDNAVSINNNAAANQVQVDSSKDALYAAGKDLKLQVYNDHYIKDIADMPYFGMHQFGMTWGALPDNPGSGGVVGPYDLGHTSGINSSYHDGVNDAVYDDYVRCGFKYNQGASWVREWFRGFFCWDLRGFPTDYSHIVSATVNYQNGIPGWGVTMGLVAILDSLSSGTVAGISYKTLNRDLYNAGPIAYSVDRGANFDYTAEMKALMQSYGNRVYQFMLFINAGEVNQNDGGGWGFNYYRPRIDIVYQHTV